MSGTIICPNCNGNGYVGNSKEENQQDDCITCKNQGKIALTDETIWNTLQFITDETIWNTLQFITRKQ
jgi:DnaJ-class molecular chaperone